MADAQTNDPDTKEWEHKLKSFPLDQGKQIWCNIDTIHPRPFVPSQFRRLIFDKFHSLSHPGIKSSLKIVRDRYIWPMMEKDIKEWCRMCEACQSTKINKHIKPHCSFQVPVTGRFQVVHVDIVGPLPLCQGDNTIFKDCRYLLTMIDRATRWVEAVPITQITAESVASAFINAWIARYGVALYIITDRGRQFESEIFTHLSQLIGFHRLRSTAYHPQTNGMVERFHRTLKSAIMARGSRWLEHLPVVLLGIRCIPNENGVAPFTALTGQTLFAPHVLTSPVTIRSGVDFVQKLAAAMSQVDFALLAQGINHGQKPVYIPQTLRQATHVWIRIDRIRRPLEAPYAGPFRVKQLNDKTVTVTTEAGKEETVSLNRVKPAIRTPQVSVPQQQKKPLDDDDAVIPKPTLTTDDVSKTTVAESHKSTTEQSPKILRSGRRVHFRPDVKFATL